MTLHKYGSSKLNNEELTKVAEYLSVKQTTTTTYSAYQNYINERNHQYAKNYQT